MENLPTRNNNPGDIRDTSSGSFKQFQSPQEGYAALLNDLQAKKTGNTSTGLGPNSSLVDFAKTWAPASDSNNPAQYAANLANHMGVRPDAKLSELDVGKWADAVSSSEGYAGQSPSSQSASPAVPQAPQQTPPVIAASNGIPPPPTNPLGIQTAQASDTGTPVAQPKSFGGELLDVGKKAVNFLFPIAGDIYHDVKGDSTKTPLQQVGDAGLSALPFIPGLGEAGEAARAAKLGIEGAGIVADAAKGAGLASKVIASPAARGAAAGYGAGVSGNLSEGKSIPESLAPNVNTIAGTVLGGATPIAGKILSAFAKGAAGISPGLENALRHEGQGDVSTLEKYIKGTEARSKDITAPSAQNMAADELDRAAKILQQKKQAAGQTVGATNKAGSAVPLKDVTPAIDSFKKSLDDRFGYTIKGSRLVSTRPIGIDLGVAQKARIMNVYKKLQTLSKGGTVRMADDVMSNLDNLVDHSIKDNYGKTADPLEGLLKSTRKAVNDVARNSSPEFASANDRFAQLQGLQKEVSNMAGKGLQRGELLMRRVFSGDKGADVTKLFKEIEKETGVNLVKHAVFAKYVTDTLGNSYDKTLLHQAIEGGIQAHTGGLIPAALKIAGGIAKKTIANPVRIGKDLVKGKGAGVLNSRITRGAIEASRFAKPLETLATPRQ